MSWKIIFDAFALMLVLEGLFPFLSPRKYKQFLIVMLAQSEKHLHTVGLVLMFIGLFIATLVHSL